VAGDGIAMVKVAMLPWIEFNLLVIFQPPRDAAIRFNLFNHGKVAISDAKRLVRRGELDAIAFGEFSADLAVDADAGQAARVVGGLFTGGFFDSK
jgi:hypothetical protein